MFRSITLALLAITALTLGFIAPAGAEEDGCVRLDMEVVCTVTPARTILVGDPFKATATVRNTGDLALANVTLALRGGAGVTHVGTGQLEMLIQKLEPGETRTLEATFVSDQVGERRINASAREERGWAAAGCYCGILIKGLPAIQVEMIDVDANRNAKGIFEVGENFIYTLQVLNDVGTALTPDLRVNWTLPPELEFVSGVGDRGATVTGSGQSGQSSSFVLAPDQVQNFEITVRVISVPPRNLVQTRASVVSAAGAQELATETESTTLKPAAR